MLPQPLREIMSKFNRAKYGARRAQGQVKRAQGSAKKISGKKKSPSEPTPAPTSNPEPVSGSTVPVFGSTVPKASADSKPGMLVPAVVGVLGAIGAPLLGLGIADNSDDRLLLGAIGLPLGAILAVGVVISYRWAGLIDR